MRRHFGKRTVSLFVASFFMLAGLVGCSNGKEIKEDVTETELSGEIASTSISDKISGEMSDESKAKEQIETEQDKSSEIINEDSENKESTDELNTDADNESKGTFVAETNSKSNDKTTESETTSKSNYKPGEKQTTENKTTQSTTKPTNSTTQKTTSKPKPTEQTTTEAKVSKAEQMAKEIVDDIITSKMTDFEKALIIHDWLIFNFDYDFTYSNYYVEEALTDRRCVCQGYALTFKMMCEMAGLEVIYVTGEGYSGNQWGGHAWNQVCIDGQWYNVDVTWDDPASPGKDFNDHSGNRHDYFLISDTRINIDHRATSSGRQSCSKDYDRVTIVKTATNNVYHSSFGFATNAEEMATEINRLIEANQSEIYIKYYEPNLTLDSMWEGLWDKLKLAKYPIIGDVSAYEPKDGIATYILKAMPLSEWNKITVITSEEQLNELMDATYNNGNTSFTVRYEPIDGNVWFSSEKYMFSQNGRVEYNGGKAIYTTIEITGLQQ